MSGTGFLDAQRGPQPQPQPAPAVVGNDASKTDGANKGTPSDPTKNTNTTDFTDFVESVWSPPEQKPQPQQNGQQPPQQQQQAPAPQQPDVKAQLDRLFKDAGIDSFAFSPEDKEKFGNGDFSPMEGAIAAAMQKAFTAAIQTSSKLVTAGLAKATDAAKAGSRQYVDGLQLREQLNKELPFTKDPSVGPIAEGIMRQAMDRGYKPAQAIAATKAVFARMFEQVAPVLGENGNTNIGDSYVANRGSEPVDFTSVLKGLDQTTRR